MRILVPFKLTLQLDAPYYDEEMRDDGIEFSRELGERLEFSDLAKRTIVRYIDSRQGSWIHLGMIVLESAVDSLDMLVQAAGYAGLSQTVLDAIRRTARNRYRGDDFGAESEHTAFRAEVGEPFVISERQYESANLGVYYPETFANSVTSGLFRNNAVTAFGGVPGNAWADDHLRRRLSGLERQLMALKSREPDVPQSAQFKVGWNFPTILIAAAMLMFLSNVAERIWFSDPPPSQTSGTASAPLIFDWDWIAYPKDAL